MQWLKTRPRWMRRCACMPAAPFPPFRALVPDDLRPSTTSTSTSPITRYQMTLNPTPRRPSSNLPTCESTPPDDRTAVIIARSGPAHGSRRIEMGVDRVVWWSLEGMVAPGGGTHLTMAHQLYQIEVRYFSFSSSFAFMNLFFWQFYWSCIWKMPYQLFLRDIRNWSIADLFYAGSTVTLTFNSVGDALLFKFEYFYCKFPFNWLWWLWRLGIWELFLNPL